MIEPISVLYKNEATALHFRKLLGLLKIEVLFLITCPHFDLPKFWLVSSICVSL